MISIRRELDITGAPYFDKINLDFRNLATQGTGELVFDLNPQYDTNVGLGPLRPAAIGTMRQIGPADVTPQSGNMLLLQSASPATMVNNLPAGQAAGRNFHQRQPHVSGNRWQPVVLDAGGGTAIGNVAGNSTLGIQTQLASDGAVQVTAGQLSITGGIDTNAHHLSFDVAGGARDASPAQLRARAGWRNWTAAR